MSEIDKNYLDVAILSMLAHTSMNPSEILLELNQQGSDLLDSAVNFEILNLTKSKLILKDPKIVGKYMISTKGKQSLGNLFSFLLNHVNLGAWNNLEPIREEFLKTAELNPGSVVLDCSSGIGDWFSKDLSSKVGKNGQVLFLSQDPRFDIEYFEKLILKNPEFSNISFIIKSEFIGKIESNTVDAVFQIFGLHMYENVGVIMQEMGRILKPGKKIVICDPLEIDHFIFNQYRKMHSKLHTGTTPENLRNILHQAGFTNIKINSLDGLCIASAEKLLKISGIIPLQPLIRKEDEQKEKEKHYYKL
ncbi:MAG: class I SAM-dependent methyltransferase [Promethearchaeota archaeon]